MWPGGDRALRQRGIGAGAALVLAASVLAGCTSEGGPVTMPSPVPPTPTPAPPLRPGALAFVLDGAGTALNVFEVDGVTGQLRFLGAYAQSEARLVAADPLGRSIYVAGGDSRGAVPSHVRSYSADRATGLLTLRSQVTWDSLMRPPLSLAASTRQVYVVGGRPFTGTHGGWVAFDVDSATASLAAAPRPPLRFEPDLVVSNAESSFVCTTALEATGPFSPTLFVSTLRAGGTLEDVGSTAAAESSTAAVLGRGFLVVADSEGGLTSYAADESSGRLTLRDHLPSALDSGPARLALDADGLLAASGRGQLRVFALGSEGNLALRDEIALASSSVPRSVAFHPTGRYLYLSGGGEGVRVFAVGAEGRLQDVGREPQGGGGLALIALPGSP